MIEADTIKLLRECDAGIKMGVEAIEEVQDHVENSHFRKRLLRCKEEHNELKKEVETCLSEFQDEGKNPNPMVKTMSWMKTNAMLSMDKSDAAIADLMTDGCNMGVKSLNRYLNQYKAADEKTKDIAKRLINLEERLTVDIREYL